MKAARSVVSALTGLTMIGICAGSTSEAAAEQSSPTTIEPDVRSLESRPTVPQDPRELFKLLDENGDGVIDRAEWRRRKMLVFFLRDKDRDIQLSRDELPNLSADVFDAADAKGNGVLSGYEFNQADFTRFEAADLDSDGFVTVDEFLAFLSGTEIGS